MSATTQRNRRRIRYYIRSVEPSAGDLFGDRGRIPDSDEIERHCLWLAAIDSLLMLNQSQFDLNGAESKFISEALAKVTALDCIAESMRRADCQTALLSAGVQQQSWLSGLGIAVTEVGWLGFVIQKTKPTTGYFETA